MNIVFTILAAFPIGFLVKDRVLAVVGYLAADALLFAFQTVGVLLAWMGQDQGMGGEAFGPKPTAFPATYSNSQLIGYGLVNLLIVLVGVGLVVGGSVVARRRATRRTTVTVG